MSNSLSLKRFVGKVAVVTGASSGIGKAIAEELVKLGINVAGLARREDRLKEHAQQLKNEKGRLYAFKCDLTVQEELLFVFKNITENLGPIYILVNNAGVSLPTGIIDGDIQKWKIILDTNVLAFSICIREAVKSMKANNIKGHIININSTSGHRVVDVPGFSLYPASKHAVTALTETLRLEINRENLPIKVTSLSPGYVKTEFVEVAFEPQRAKEIIGLEAKDVADAAIYILATPEHVNTLCVTHTVHKDIVKHLEVITNLACFLKDLV